MKAERKYFKMTLSILVGCALMMISTAGAVISWFIFRHKKKKMYGELEEAYGKRRR